MALPLEEILGLEGNKYEKTAAMIKYARFLAQKNDDSLEVPVGRNRWEKLTLVAMQDILSGRVSYELEPGQDEKK